MDMTIYEKKKASIDELLVKDFITYTVQYRGVVTGAFGEGDHKSDSWLLTFERGTKQMGTKEFKKESFEFFTGMGNRSPAKSVPFEQKGWLNPRCIAYAEREEAREATRKPVNPRAADILHCSMMDASMSEGSFEDFCSECGYDTDSRKALETYLACQEVGNKFRRLFNREEIAFISEALQDY